MGLVIKVLGTGCTKCQKTADMIKDFVKDNSIDATIEKIEDIMEIMKYDVMSTPAVVVNEEVKISGRVPSKSQLEDALINNIEIKNDKSSDCGCSCN